MGRVRSISTGRIPLKGGRSISSSRVGIGARRVRSTSAARSVEASRRPLGESQMGFNEETIGGESTLQSRRESGDRFNERKQCTSASPSRAHSKGKKRVTFCEDVIEHEPCEYSDDSMEEGEVDSGKEQKEEDSEEEEQVVKDANKEKEDVELKEADDHGVEQDKEELDEGDMRDIDMEVRSSSPPAVWAKKAV